jgi:hypothetical protein
VVNNRLVLDFMAMRAMKVTDSVPVDSIGGLRHRQGLELGPGGGCPHYASIEEWILLVRQNVHLLQAGYAASGPANDNAPPY